MIFPQVSCWPDALRSAFSTILLFLLLPFAAYCQDSPSINTLTAPTAAEYQPLVDRIQKAARITKKSDKSSLSILVTNFLTSDEGTSILGMRFGDALAQALAQSQGQQTVVPRSHLRDLLVTERIAAKYLVTRDTQRWLGRKLGANIVISGDLDYRTSPPVGNFNVLVKNHPERDQSFQMELPNLPVEPGDLLAAEPFQPFESKTVGADGQPLPRYDPKKGMTAPACFVTPTPAYSDEARNARVDGTMLLEAIITTEGQLKNIRVVNGLPGGLNQVAIETLAKWRCRPGAVDGKPTPMIIPLEIAFHLHS